MLGDPDGDLRVELRAWLEQHPSPTASQLVDAGLVAPHWPPPWGLGATPEQQLIVDEELAAAKIDLPVNPIGIGWAGPTILVAGTDEQRARYLPPMLRGEEFWCQLFSEPEAGSDLASLRTFAARDGSDFVVNGQKVWTTLAHEAAFGILLARTNADAAPRRGLTYFICPMDSPGIEVRPLRQMTGDAEFNEVFFNDVRIPESCVVGEVDGGWALAKVTLANERVSLSKEGAIWGHGPNAGDLLDLVRAAGGEPDPCRRQRLAQLYIESEILRLIRLRSVTAMVKGRQPGPESSVRKALGDRHGQQLLRTARDLCGAAGMLATGGPYCTADPVWPYGFLYSPALTIGGGTAEVQRNILAELVLGLPREPRPAAP